MRASVVVRRFLPWAAVVLNLYVHVVASKAAARTVNVPPAFLELLCRMLLLASSETQQLGQQVSYSSALVGLVENAKRVPSRDFAERCDEALSTGGALVRLWPLVSREMLPGWFRPWIEIEREATALRSFEPLIIPGLLQTPHYARTLLAAQPAGTEDELEQLVVTRMERQAILSRENPPHLWCLLDEGGAAPLCRGC